MTKIKVLNDYIISQIAAGEVVSRPMSVVKELIENSIDSKATNIDIHIQNGGKTLISVQDNGIGINSDELKLAITPHATSKIKDNDITNIKNLGFRGEALAAIASVSKFTISSKTKTQNQGYSLTNDNNENIFAKPMNNGTMVSVRDIFYSIPARLKFLSSESYEMSLISSLVKSFGIATPNISFSLRSNGRKILSFKNQEKCDDLGYQQRISTVLGEEFIKSSIKIKANKNDVSLVGYTSIPTLNKTTSKYIYTYVNNRIINDKTMKFIINDLYSDFIPKGRFPVTVLFLSLPSEQVDVNVHPSKTEIKFREQQFIRKFLYEAIGNALNKDQLRDSSASLTTKSSAFFTSNRDFNKTSMSSYRKSNSDLASPIKHKNNDNNWQSILSLKEKTYQDDKDISFLNQGDKDISNFNNNQLNLGQAIYQVANSYIISYNGQSLFIIDQHAAHERIVYEQLKAKKRNTKILSQALLDKTVVKLNDVQMKNIIQHNKTLLSSGLKIIQKNKDYVEVLAIPSILEKSDIKKLITLIADDLLLLKKSTSLTKEVNSVLASMACYNAIRFGRKLSLEEMNNLLKQIQTTPNSAQCNHGRPTYVQLSLKDIQKIFERA